MVKTNVYPRNSLEELSNPKFTSSWNDCKIPKRRFEIKGDKGSIKYDAYKTKSLILKVKNEKTISYSFKNTSLENLLKVFHDAIIHKRKINDINLSVKVMKIIFLIQKKINIKIG